MKKVNYNKKKTRKDNITMFFLAVFFIAIGIVTGTIESHYSIEGSIIEVSADETLIKDTTGNLWTIFENDYTVGETVKITFDNNKTDNTRVDDYILKVEKTNK